MSDVSLERALGFGFVRSRMARRPPS